MPEEPLDILVVGCTPLARAALRVVEEHPALRAVGLVNLDPVRGAGKARYDACAEFAGRRPQDVHWTDDINGDAAHRFIADREPHVVLQCGWSQIFSTELLAIASVASVGIHPSPLPVGRGAAVINWRIIEGGGPWANSLFVMADRTDVGNILDQEPFEIEPRDDIRTAYEKVDRTGALMVGRSLPNIRSLLPGREQDESKVTRYRSRTADDGRCAWDWPAERILAYVRALTEPYPGAFFDTSGGRLVVWKAVAAEPCAPGTAPGTILETGQGGLRVATGGETSVWLVRVTHAAGIACWADEWAAALDLEPGDVLLP